MKRGTMAVLAVVVAAGAGLVMAQPAAEKPKGEAAAQKVEKKADALDKFRAMAGTWTGKSDGANEIPNLTVHYKVTSAGSAVVETLFPGSEHEMVTVYFLNGGDVWMTHYCAMGNQPTMKGAFSADGKEIDFSLASVTNCDAKTGTCMGKAHFTFTDADHVSTKWYMVAKGGEHEHVRFTLTRQK